MAYEQQYPKCPYRSKGNRKCCHKGCPKHCDYVFNPEECEAYNEWSEGRKIDSSSLETRKTAIGDSINE